MVQGPNEVEALLALQQAATTQAVQRKRHTAEEAQAAQSAGLGLVQGPDTVQLSANAVQAAAYAKLDAVQEAAAHGAPSLSLLRKAAAVTPVAAPATVAAPTPVAVPSPVIVAPTPPAVPHPQANPVTPAPAPVAAAISAAAVAQAAPEVRPTQVQAALSTLGNLTGSSGELNSRLAEKLLTEI